MSILECKNDLVLAARQCLVGEMVCECDSDTFQVFKAGDDGSDPKVIYLLGKCYFYGWGTARNLKSAVQCYVRAAELGSYEALQRLQDLYYNQSVKTNLQNAFGVFCEKADQGDIRSQFNAGYCYFEGIGTSQDRAKARDLFQMAADQGCADVMWILDVCRRVGVGEGYKGMYGIELLKYAAQMQSAEAQYQLGYAYVTRETTYGLKVEQDFKQAVEWYQKAADQNHITATHDLACCYYFGQGVQKDIKKAFQLFKKAALMGNANAQNSISDFYSHKRSELSENQYPVGIDYYEAIYQNKKANDQGYYLKQSILEAIGLTHDQIDELENQTSSFESAKTWYNIAKQYETGNEVEKDEQKAFKMYRLSARLGSIPAKTALGRSYETGIGTGVDLSQAVHWYEKAAIQGDYEAAVHFLNFIQPESAEMALKEGSAFAALVECYQTGSGVPRNEDTALLMREHAAVNGDIEQAKIVIEVYMSGNGNEHRIRSAGSIVAKTSGISRKDYQQFIELFNDSIDELDKMLIFLNTAAAIRAESMGIMIVFD